MKIKYKTSVKVTAGWRTVEVVAFATQVSPGYATVDDVLSIDGETPNRKQSRTGSKRQSFDGTFWATVEIGKRKRISALEIIN